MYADNTTLFCNFDATCNSEKINSEIRKSILMVVFQQIILKCWQNKVYVLSHSTTNCSLS